MSHTILIEITPQGDFSAEVNGVQGPQCSDISKWLDSLGNVELDEKTPDYYKKGKQTVKNRSIK